MENEKVLKVIGTMKLISEKIEIDFYGDFNNPYFLASDLAKCLGVKNVSQMLKQADLSDEQKGIFLKYTLGGDQKTLFVDEDGLYEVCMTSRKQIAKILRKEIKKYLKQIRMTGGYIPIKEEDTPEMIVAKGLKIADETIKKKDMIISELKPKAKAYDDLINSNGLFTLKEVADIIETGRTKLCTLLRKNKVLSKQTGYNEPMGRFVTNKYFEVVTKVAPNKQVSAVTLVTPKGLNYIYKLIKKADLLDEFDTTSLLSSNGATL